MRRLLLGLAAFGFLLLVGIEAFHSHAGAAPDNCAVCALTAQAARHLPAAQAASIPAAGWVALPDRPFVPQRSASRPESSARAPPTA